MIYQINENMQHEKFEMLSIKQINMLISDIYNVESPIAVDPDVNTVNDVPLIKMITYFMKNLELEKEIKLTQRGYLPPVLIKELYSKRFILDDAIESGITKLCTENDSNIVVLVRKLSELSGLVKKRNNKLSLTAKGRQLLNMPIDLFHEIFKAFSDIFNWTYFDAYSSEKIAQVGYGYSIFLISKYGKNKQADRYYAEKYFEAFPNLKMDVLNNRYPNEEYHCYSTRTFERYLNYFGVIDIEGQKYSERIISKNLNYDKIFKMKYAANGA